MKTLSLNTTTVVFMLLFTTGIQAQITQTKLNQVELMKQFLGNWNGELGRDSIGTLVCKSFYNGFDFYFKIETKGKIVFEEKTLSGYDKKYDKLIKIWVQNINPEFGILALWFTSANICEEVLFEDISNPEKAVKKWKFEFKSPDLLIWTNIKNKKTTGTKTFHRVKK